MKQFKTFYSLPRCQADWRIVHMTFNISPSTSRTIFFENWLHGVSKKDKVQVRVGSCALLWAI
jgi:hypothetical protein